ncbi:collagen alpha-1(I) chain-like [Antechinus flavipes]|uniref:collagen alpha-1(I) chain-like n=1 Tax=Antechinus flavipes TaxID=38775 RepID=UPI0022359C2D|nr:collagen alpha-1(I) chain-like [Antechinus flavipes]
MNETQTPSFGPSPDPSPEDKYKAMQSLTSETWRSPGRRPLCVRKSPSASNVSGPELRAREERGAHSLTAKAASKRPCTEMVRTDKLGSPGIPGEPERLRGEGASPKGAQTASQELEGPSETVRFNGLTLPPTETYSCPATNGQTPPPTPGVFPVIHSAPKRTGGSEARAPPGRKSLTSLGLSGVLEGTNPRQQPSLGALPAPSRCSPSPGGTATEPALGRGLLPWAGGRPDASPQRAPVFGLLGLSQRLRVPQVGPHGLNQQELRDLSPGHSLSNAGKARGAGAGYPGRPPRDFSPSRLRRLGASAGRFPPSRLRPFLLADWKGRLLLRGAEGQRREGAGKRGKRSGKASRGHPSLGSGTAARLWPRALGKRSAFNGSARKVAGYVSDGLHKCRSPESLGFRESPLQPPDAGEKGVGLPNARRSQASQSVPPDAGEKGVGLPNARRSQASQSVPPDAGEKGVGLPNSGGLRPHRASHRTRERRGSDSRTRGGLGPHRASHRTRERRGSDSRTRRSRASQSVPPGAGEKGVGLPNSGGLRPHRASHRTRERRGSDSRTAAVSGLTERPTGRGREGGRTPERAAVSGLTERPTGRGEKGVGLPNAAVSGLTARPTGRRREGGRTPEQRRSQASQSVPPDAGEKGVGLPNSGGLRPHRASHRTRERRGSDSRTRSALGPHRASHRKPERRGSDSRTAALSGLTKRPTGRTPEQRRSQASQSVPPDAGEKGVGLPNAGRSRASQSVPPDAGEKGVGLPNAAVSGLTERPTGRRREGGRTPEQRRSQASQSVPPDAGEKGVGLPNSGALRPHRASHRTPDRRGSDSRTRGALRPHRASHRAPERRGSDSRTLGGLRPASQSVPPDAGEKGVGLPNSGALRPHRASHRTLQVTRPGSVGSDIPDFKAGATAPPSARKHKFECTGSHRAASLEGSAGLPWGGPRKPAPGRELAAGLGFRAPGRELAAGRGFRAPVRELAAGRGFRASGRGASSRPQGPRRNSWARALTRPAEGLPLAADPRNDRPAPSVPGSGHVCVGKTHVTALYGEPSRTRNESVPSAAHGAGRRGEDGSKSQKRHVLQKQLAKRPGPVRPARPRPIPPGPKRSRGLRDSTSAPRDLAAGNDVRDSVGRTDGARGGGGQTAARLAPADATHPFLNLLGAPGDAGGEKSTRVSSENALAARKGIGGGARPFLSLNLAGGRRVRRAREGKRRTRLPSAVRMKSGSGKGRGFTRVKAPLPAGVWRSPGRQPKCIN